ncbi:MAG: ABC transporter ATP-binding protein [Sandaracinaceae bacterium]|nr:ABC transporter ATP-binding protein [Sandaracinaceae bacterium]
MEGEGVPPISSWIRPYRRSLGIGVLLLVLTNAAERAIPYFLAKGVDALVAQAFEQVLRALSMALAIALLAWIVRTGSRIFIFNVGRDVERDLRQALLESIHRLAPYAIQKWAPGDLLSRSTGDIPQVRLWVGFGTLNVLNSAFALISTIALLFWLSPRLALLALAPLPIVVWIALRFAQALLQSSSRAQGALSALSERIHEDLVALHLDRGTGLEVPRRRAFEEKNKALYLEQLRLARLRSAMMPVLMMPFSFGAVLTMGYGGWLVASGEITPGTLGAFFTYLAQLLWPVVALGWILSIHARGKAAYARIVEILEAAQREGKPQIECLFPPRPWRGEIALRLSGFEREGKRCLGQIAIDIKAGSLVAIVGKTGSGKSTLAALLGRMLPLPPNALFIDGIDAASIPLSEYRRIVRFLPEEPFLFSTTIRANLSLALGPHADPDSEDALLRYREALAQAQVLKEVDALPLGLDTCVGERGLQLSGGQRQRIALARTLIDPPPVLILDQPTSAVDVESEERIVDALFSLRRRHTIIVVTHRGAWTRRADCIFVLEGGHVVEAGSHEVLLRKRGHYARLLEEEIEAQGASSFAFASHPHL